MTQETSQGTWGFPTTVWFGAGRAAQIADAVRATGAAAPLLVTDGGLADHPMRHALTRALGEAGIAAGLFTDVQPNPTGENVAAGVEAFLAGGHDAVIALGGGSALDAGKAVALMAGQTRPIWDFEDIGDNWRRADAGAIRPVVAIPTTAGTGSELGRASVISDTQAARKVIVFHPDMLPRVVIMDPELTVGLPPMLTAGTGMDALSHALEAWCAPSYHPMADGLAVQAMSMIREALPRVHHDPSDVAARGEMLAASGMACVALQKGLGAVHALSHPLGALHDAHHGVLNAILLPHVLRQNWPAIEPRMALLSSRLGLGGQAEDVPAWIEGLTAELGVPRRLSDIGVEPVDRRRVAAMALLDPSAKGNPVEMTEEMGIEILAAAS